MVDSYFSVDIENLRGHSQNGTNMFTDAHILQSLSVAAGPFVARSFFADGVPAALAATGDAMARAVVADLREFGGGRIHELHENSEIVTLYSLRAIESARYANAFAAAELPPEIIPELRTAARSDVLRQLGLATAHDPEFEPGALLVVRR